MFRVSSAIGVGRAWSEDAQLAEESVTIPTRPIPSHRQPPDATLGVGAESIGRVTRYTRQRSVLYYSVTI